jgi:LuxR family maltose regulon positive regulatory protein
MARGLYLAPNTVRTHIKSIYRKLGVSSRKQAVEEAYLRKLLL